MDSFKQIMQACGITINGPKNYDIKIHNPDFMKRFYADPQLCIGEAYMNGDWTVDNLDEMSFRVMRHIHTYKFDNKAKSVAQWALSKLYNMQSKLRSKQVALKHYNLGNDLYEPMLGPSMAYTCGYWKNATDLDSAQFAKYQLICDKINLQPGDTVLDIGCGFGGLSNYIADKYDCTVTAVNISTEQLAYANAHKANANVRFICTDYRDTKNYNPNNIKFDKIVTVGLCEHIGYKNYKAFMRIIKDQLKEDGLALLHTIGKNDSKEYSDPWVRKYIFPGGILPSIKRLASAAEDCFVIEDIHNFGADYDKTLIAWYNNFKLAWPDLQDKYGPTFFKMWEYYLLACAGAFRSRDIGLWQFVLSPKGVIDGYKSIR